MSFAAFQYVMTLSSGAYTRRWMGRAVPRANRGALRRDSCVVHVSADAIQGDPRRPLSRYRGFAGWVLIVKKLPDPEQIR